MTVIRFATMVVALACCFALGCGPSAEPTGDDPSIDETTNTGTEGTQTEGTQTEGTDAEGSETKGTDSEGSPAADDAAAGNTPQENQPTTDNEPVALNPATGKQDSTDDAQAASVQLGSAQLTSGIPGEGDLTVAQIQAWLDEPANHAPLSVTLPTGLAASASAVYIPEDNPITKAKIELGRQLYFDKRLSSDNTVSCADCHHPDEGYSRHTQFGVGVDGQEGNRNSPVSYNRIVSRAQFWDGRADSLEAQAIGPIANPIEMGNTHEKAVAMVAGLEGYKIQFEAIFGGDVDIEKIGKAIATFERAVVTGPSAYDFYEPLRSFEMAFADELEDLDSLKEEEPELYDRYQKLLADSDSKPMSESARRGREIFFSDRGACTACHAGANFTDEKYHNLGIGMTSDDPDLGRFAETKEEKDRGAFKTPTVRNVVQSAPYMHDGSLKTLEEVVEWYAKGGHANPNLSEKMKKLNLNDQDKADLVAFMKACTGDLPQVETGRLP